MSREQVIGLLGGIGVPLIIVTSFWVFMDYKSSKTACYISRVRAACGINFSAESKKIFLTKEEAESGLAALKEQIPQKCIIVEATVRPEWRSWFCSANY